MKRYNNNSVLLIPDTHAPYQHKDALVFLEAVANKYNPDRIFHLGDWTDSYCFSSYPKDMEAPGYTREYKKVREFTRKLIRLFPSGICMEGNHDSRLWNRRKLAGLPLELVLPYSEVIGMKGTGWRLEDDYTFRVEATKEHWYLAHTRTGTAINCARNLGMSVAFGHLHTLFGIESFMSLDKRCWGVQAGCLISDNRHAFAYNRQSIIRPNLGCVVILRGIPKLIPLVKKANGRWNGKIE